jgi:hypothetical protein
MASKMFSYMSRSILVLVLSCTTFITTPSVRANAGSWSHQTAQYSRAELVIRIDKALARLPRPSAYLYETNNVSGIVSSTWMELTAPILGTKNLRIAYDNFYQSAVEYAVMAEINFRRAKKAVQNNDLATGTRRYEVGQRYEQQFHLNDKAAIQIFNGNIGAAAELARGIYEGSKAAVVYGGNMVMGPVGSRVVDSVFDVTDLAVEVSDNGFTVATKKFVAGKLTEMIFSETPLTSKSKNTLKDAIDQNVTKMLGQAEVYKIVQEVVSRPEFAKVFMGFIAKTSSYAASKVSEKQIDKVIQIILKNVTVNIPSLTKCGSKWWHVGLAQLIELEQSTLWKYSFDEACQAHDKCYRNCEMQKTECDKKLLADAYEVCAISQNMNVCHFDADLFYKLVLEKGDEPFKSARSKCPDSPNLPHTKTVNSESQSHNTIKSNKPCNCFCDPPSVSTCTEGMSGTNQPAWVQEGLKQIRSSDSIYSTLYPPDKDFCFDEIWVAATIGVDAGIEFSPYVKERYIVQHKIPQPLMPWCDGKIQNPLNFDHE